MQSPSDEITEDDLQAIYNWVDEIPLSRPKRNIARDFSDGVLLAEIIKHSIPKLVDLHNYSQAHSVSQKTYNWNTLNVKVLKKLGLSLSKQEIEAVVNMEPDAIEKVLIASKFHVEQFMTKRRANPSAGGTRLPQQHQQHQQFQNHPAPMAGQHVQQPQF